MGKHEPMDPKAIANAQKAKGLQKLKFYCQMCQKQCRDDNGFKCHINSESHERQLLLFAENSTKYINEFSKDFREGFIYLLKTRYGTRRVLANTVYQDYIKERNHIHMNATQWTNLTEFCNWLGKNSLVHVDHNEKGVFITYIDRDPETLRRQEMDEKKRKHHRDTEDYIARTIKKQIDLGKQADAEASTSSDGAPKPVPFMVISKEKKDDEEKETSMQDADASNEELHKGEGLILEYNNFRPVEPNEPTSSSSTKTPEVEVKPVFNIEPIELKLAKKPVLLKRPGLLRPPNFVKKTKIKKN